MSDEPNTIIWTRPKLERLKLAYKRAAAATNDKDFFTFEGNEYVIGYAKYLIEYLEIQLK